MLLPPARQLGNRVRGDQPCRGQQLDAIDRKILAELQADGRMTNVELSRRVGISAPPCLRRVRTLEETGLIQGYHAQINARELGFEVQVFAMVGLSSQAERDLSAFEAKCRGWSLVRECHMLNGEIDFILKCVAPDLSTFQTFLTEELTAAPNVGERQDQPRHPLRQGRAGGALRHLRGPGQGAGLTVGRACRPPSPRRPHRDLSGPAAKGRR